jgi:signal transduction histidine kinase
MTTQEPHRILIVDDNRGVHEEFRKVLTSAELSAVAEASLFGGACNCPAAAPYELDFATQGQEALAKVTAALAEGRPYSLAFVDMRMPPGWDGVETVSRICKEDTAIQIVICTAYSDYTWQDIINKLGRSDRLLILKKPFDVTEICQLAGALTQKWAASRQAGIKTTELERLVMARTADLLEANAELQRHNDQLRSFYDVESERNHLRDTVHSMEQVVGIIGHELRTPLGCIRGLSEMMLKTAAAADQSAAGMLEGINKTAREMAQTLDSLLEAARLHSGLATWNWATVDVQTVCQEAVVNVRPMANTAGAPITLNVTPNDLKMSGDPDAVRRLLVNLLHNADRHTSSGRISITAAALRDNDLNWIELTITDTGSGIAPNLISRLGEPFALNRGVVGENCVHGAGLGLAICKSIAQGHGGKIDIQSAAGAGTTVIVRLRQDLPGPPNAGTETPAALAKT